MKLFASLISGLTGSIVLTVSHQILKKKFSAAPRLDKLGEEAISKLADDIQWDIGDEEFYETSLAADLAGNGVYYSLVGAVPGAPVLTGAALGIAAGVGAITLPEKMGLDPEYTQSTPARKVLSVALYLGAGLAAGLAYSLLNRDRD